MRVLLGRNRIDPPLPDPWRHNRRASHLSRHIHRARQNHILFHHTRRRSPHIPGRSLRIRVEPERIRSMASFQSVLGQDHLSVVAGPSRLLRPGQ
jgi:hypothetical protein